MSAEQVPNLVRANPIGTLRVYLATGNRAADPAQTPRVEIVVGRDAVSAGMSVTAYVCDEDRKLAVQLLDAHRWLQAPQSVEECLTVAHEGLKWYMRKAGIVFE